MQSEFINEGISFSSPAGQVLNMWVSRKVDGHDFGLEFRTDLKKKKISKELLLARGRWTEKEHLRYVAFLHQKNVIDPDSVIRRKDKKRQRFFIEMSKFVKSRTPNQCKSYDQKIQLETTEKGKMILSPSESRYPSKEEIKESIDRPRSFDQCTFMAVANYLQVLEFADHVIKSGSIVEPLISKVE
jgi:hypothetical protein